MRGRAALKMHGVRSQTRASFDTTHKRLAYSLCFEVQQTRTPPPSPPNHKPLVVFSHPRAPLGVEFIAAARERLPQPQRDGELAPRAARVRLLDARGGAHKARGTPTRKRSTHTRRALWGSCENRAIAAQV